MSTIIGMLKRFEGIDTDQVIYQVMQDSEQDIVDLNREQMYDGKTNLDTNIRPLYIEDPYFKGDIIRAQAYSDWKDSITPNSRRNPGVPNLYINGFFHSSIRVTVLPDTIVFDSSWTEGDDIEKKFKNIYGLGGEHKKIFLNVYLSPVLKERMEQETGLQFN